jgi:heme A synthase
VAASVRTTSPTTPDRASRSPLYSALIGLAGLGVLLQGVWAGMFVREGHENVHSWVEVHSRGAEVTIVLAALATVVALVKLRANRPLVIGSGVFTVLLVLESWLGGRVGGSPALETVHFPLAMALLGLAVWLPLRARRRPA